MIVGATPGSSAPVVVGKAENPVIPGFSPDPSIVRVGDDYWLVNSSFALFPGVPVYHSRDLVHWELVGHALDRPSQLDLADLEISEGIYAPTIRWHQGKFFLVTTLVAGGQTREKPSGHFVVTASDPRGPWSDPVWLTDAPGIDPSLLFDDDGTCWFCATREKPLGKQYFGDCEIVARPLDPRTFQWTGPEQRLWTGAFQKSVWAEGPHLYRRGEWLYLVYAEGGTERHHAVCVARSRTMAGPWEGCPDNPILTHRHHGPQASIANVGHGDLVQTVAGDWWMVVLAVRPCQGFHCLGRETFLVPVQWYQGWPVVGQGRLESTIDPPLPAVPFGLLPENENFPGGLLGPEWISIRTSFKPFVSPGVNGQGLLIRGGGFPGLFRRLRSWDSTFQVLVDVSESLGQASLTLFQSESWHYRLSANVTGASRLSLVVVECCDGHERPVATASVPIGPLVLGCQIHDLSVSFFYGFSAQDRKIIADGLDGSILSTERAGGFVGTLVGLQWLADGNSNLAVEWWQTQS